VVRDGQRDGLFDRSFGHLLSSLFRFGAANKPVELFGLAATRSGAFSS